MDARKFQHYLSTGEYVPAEDMSLAEHDKRWHPQGYKEGDKCLFRSQMAKGDESDAAVRNSETGGISGIFTGSSADYSKPSVMHIGSGEGSQVYGWGLYGSNVRGIAEGYADNDIERKGLKEDTYHYVATYNGEKVDPFDMSPKATALRWIEQFGGIEDAIAGVKEYSNPKRGSKKEALDFLEANKDKFSVKRVRDGGHTHLYEQTFFTNRAPGDESHLMKWYGKVTKPQRKMIKAQAEKEGLNVSNLLWDGGEIQGAMLYSYLATPSYLGSPKAVSEFLYRAGIDGIQYPVDSYGGKTVKDGNKAGWNYVAFSDDHIRVDRKWRDGEEVDDEAKGKIEQYLALDASPTSLAAHDKRFHPKGFDPKKDHCEFREKRAKQDESDIIATGSGSDEKPLVARDINGEHPVVRLVDLVKGKSRDELAKWLRSNKDAYVRLYHGTGAPAVLGGGGISRTSRNNQRTSQSSRGFVYLATDPAVARRYADMGYNGPTEVYSVDLKVSELKPDKDSLFFLRRSGAESSEFGDSLADSLYYTGNARVARDIMPYEMGKTGLKKGDKADSSVLGSADGNKKPWEREYDEVIAKFKGTDKWLKAPNGEPTNLTERQWVQVRTPSFKAWFGDWEKDPANASKVIDSNGEPMIAYRRDNDNFSVFDYKKTQQNDAGWLGKGFYFYGDKGEAERSIGYGQNLRNFYLNAQNPYFISSEEYNALVEADDPQSSEEFTQRLKDEGYDSVYWNGDGRKEWMMIESRQIKSATGNSGAFSPEKENIMDGSADAPRKPSLRDIAAAALAEDK